MCEFGGCNDTAAANFDAHATYNDGTCIYHLIGCTVRGKRLGRTCTTPTLHQI
jgi:hypothetical protein